MAPQRPEVKVGYIEKEKRSYTMSSLQLLDLMDTLFSRYIHVYTCAYMYVVTLTFVCITEVGECSPVK